MYPFCSKRTKKPCAVTLSAPDYCQKKLFRTPTELCAYSNWRGSVDFFTLLCGFGSVCHPCLFHKKFAEAEEDCSQALELDDKNVKALYRRVLARKVLLVCVLTVLYWVGRQSWVFRLVYYTHVSALAIAIAGLGPVQIPGSSEGHLSLEETGAREQGSEERGTRH